MGDVMNSLRIAPHAAFVISATKGIYCPGYLGLGRPKGY